MQFLKQSTASQAVLIGPFVDSTDGDTAETGLSIANTDIRLSKNGGNLAAKNAGGATHDENGFYQITLDATDTDTPGRLQLHCKMTGALVVYHDFMVLPANVFDSLVAGIDTLQADVTQWKGAAAPDMTGDAFARLGAPAGASIAADIATVDGVADGIKTVTDALPNAGALTSLAQASDLATLDGKADAILVDTGTTLPGTLAQIAGYIDTEIAAILQDTATALPAQIAALNNLSSAEVNAACDAALADYDAPTKAELDAGLAGLSLIDAAGVRAAVGLAAADLDTQLGTLATSAALTAVDGKIDTLDTVADAVKAVTDALPDSGALTSLAHAANLATVDTVVDAIKAKTDSLTFSVSGKVDANMTHVNEVAVGGAGTTGDPWGPA